MAKLKIYFDKCEELENLEKRETYGWTGQWISLSLKKDLKLSVIAKAITESLGESIVFDKEPAELRIIADGIAVEISENECVIRQNTASKSEQTIKRILEITKSLFDLQCLTGVFGGLESPESEKIAYYNIVLLDQHDSFWKVHNENFDKIECFYKAKNADKDLLFIFKYEIPDLMEGHWIKRNNENGFILMLRSSEAEHKTILYAAEGKLNGKKAYELRFGINGYILARMFYAQPIGILIIEESIEKALEKLRATIENRGLTIIDFDKFKEEVISSAKQAEKNK